MPNDVINTVTIHGTTYDIGGSGGHTIKNPAGTAMTQRSNLQFVDLTISDDSTNDATKVESVHVIHSESELDNLPDGLYMLDEDEDTVIDGNLVGYDNTTSGLNAENVQDAIDEVVETLDDKPDKVTCATNGNLAGLDTNGNLTDSGVAASEIPELWKSQGEYGVKNLIPYPYIQSTKTQNGITFTSYSDGSVLVNGTATNDANFEVLRKSDDSLGGYWMTGGKSNGLFMRQRIVAKTGGAYIRDRRDIGSGIALDNIDASTEMYYILVYIMNGTSVNNETIYPMIRLAADTDDTYRPYAKTNKQLTDNKADKVSSATNGNLAGLNGSGNLTDSGWNGAKDTTSISGNPISIPNLKANQLAKDPIITFEPIQAGSGTPSPSNIRAISGYDKVEALSCGVNTITKYQKGGIENDGTENTNTSSCRTDFIKVIPNSSYYFIKDTNLGGYAYYIYYDSCKNFISYNNNLGTGVLNIPNNVGYVRFQFYLSGSGWGTNLPNRKDGLNYPSTQTSYVPYVKATSISESLGQTVYYGGGWDLRSGKFTVTWKKNTYTWGSSSGTLVGNNVRKNFDTLSDADLSSLRNDAISDKVPMLVSYNNDSPHFYISSAGTPYIFMPANTDASTTIDICYILATPFEIQLTPHEISLLKDYAYVSTNGTNIAFDYHNGELASLADVSQLGETVNELGETVNELGDVLKTEIKAIVETYNIGSSTLKISAAAGSLIMLARSSVGVKGMYLVDSTGEPVAMITASSSITVVKDGSQIAITNSSGVAVRISIIRPSTP